MSGLFHALQTTSNTLDAFSRAIEIEGQNVASASSPGWAALRVSIRPVGVGAGGSYDVVDVTSSSDARADSVVRSATSQSSYSQTAAAQLSPVNRLFDITGSTGILAALRDFSTAFSQVSVTPSDSVLRASALDSARSVALAFNHAATSLDTVRNQVDTAIQSTSREINALSSTIAAYNGRLRGKPEFDAQTDANIRTALDSLSSLIDVSTSKNLDGTITVLAGGTLPLVSEDQTWALGVNTGAAAGSQVTSAGGGAPPPGLRGSLGALLDARNNVLSAIIGGTGQSGSLNTLAEGFAARVNSLLTSGVTGTGAPGVPVFTWDLSTSSNVARTLSIDPAVGPANLALASSGTSAQSNGIANSLAALTSSILPADQINGLSAEGLFSGIAADVGQRTAAARSNAELDRGTLTAAENDRRQVSGVSLDREAILLTAGQRAYEAAAKLFSILDKITEAEVNLIR